MGKPNGFVIFANEYKKKHNMQHYTFRELLEALSPFWNELSEKEKDVYKARAKQDNKKRELKRGNTNNISCEIEQKRLKVERETEDMRAKIEDLVYTASDLGNLDDKIFYLLYISSYFQDLNDTYPAELGLAKYSLRNGVIDTLHIKINPGTLPIGAIYEAQEKSNKTHKYFVPTRGDDNEYDETMGENCYFQILLKIIEFLEPEDDLPIFFSEGSANSYELLQIERCLVRIFEKAGEYSIASTLKVYSLIELLYCLNACNSSSKTEDQHLEHFKTLLCADTAFSKGESLYRYAVKGCDYHEEKDRVMYCSLAKVACYGFIISKYCVNASKYPLIEGRHFPKGYQLAA